MDLLNPKDELNKTYKTLKTLKYNTLTKRGTLSLTELSKISRMSKRKKEDKLKRRRTYNYHSYLDENEFVPKHKELKEIIDNTIEHIGKTVYDLATITKETNEKVKKIVNASK